MFDDVRPRARIHCACEEICSSTVVMQPCMHMYARHRSIASTQHHFLILSQSASQLIYLSLNVYTIAVCSARAEPKSPQLAEKERAVLQRNHFITVQAPTVHTIHSLARRAIAMAAVSRPLKRARSELPALLSSAVGMPILSPPLPDGGECRAYVCHAMILCGWMRCCVRVCRGEEGRDVFACSSSIHHCVVRMLRSLHVLIPDKIDINRFWVILLVCF